MLDNPEVFGLHDNANITYQQQETDNMMETVLEIQPRISSGSGGLSPDEIVLQKAKELFEQIPDNLDRSEGKKELFKTSGALLPSLTTVLLQEMQKFNRLMTQMRNSLIGLERAIGGFDVMSDVLDKMYMSLMNGKVPANWESVAYPSLKPLISWFNDLKQRVTFVSDWLVNGQPAAFWMSGLFFPQGFMTGCLQTHARLYKIPIDKLSFSFAIMNEEEPTEVEEAPEDGVYIYGLFMDGARWNRDEQIIDDQYPSELYSRMPIILFKPIQDYVRDPEEYECPIYKTSRRQGELSTTGQSTNFIISADLPTKVMPQTWVKRSAAMLCQLND